MSRTRLSTSQAAKAKPTRRQNPIFEDSNYDGLDVRNPKRQRTSKVEKTVVQKMRPRGDQGRLARLMKMPIDIFTEVASHLMPKDIIVLSRSNKFLRNLLMRRSAIHIWRGAMRNVPKLPPCPPDMCEPEYLALIYMPICTMCGGDGPRRMDEILRVRLCNKCCDTRTMSANGLPADVDDLVLKSSKSLSGRHWEGQSALRGDVGAVLVKIEELTKSKDHTALGRWKVEREAELAKRQKQAAELSAFLDHLEYLELCRRADLISARRTEIKRRLVLLGWDEKDFQITFFNRGDWDRIVEQPVPMTDRIWTDIKPQLIRMMKSNRAVRLEKEKLLRKEARKLKFEQILEEIEVADPPLIDACIPNPSTPSAPDSDGTTIQVSHHRFFPLPVDLLTYPKMQSLEETDVPESEMEAHFEAHREEIKVHVLAWRIKIEGHMADLLRKGRVSDGLDESVPAPTLPVGDSEPNPFDGVSDDLKLLLRADSIFEFNISCLNNPVSYDTVLESANISMSWGIPRTEPVDVSSHQRHAKAQEVARALLAEMGKPDASFLELKGLGHLFKCGRCPSDSTYNWEDLIRHYVEAQSDWERVQPCLPLAQELGITFQHAHALDIHADKPLVQVLDTAQIISHEYSGPWHFRCLLCIRSGVYDPRVTQSKVIEHVTSWHGVAEPVLGEHYDRTEEDTSYEDSDEDPDDDSDDGYGVYAPYTFGHCAQGCCLFGDDDDDDDEW